MPGRRSIADVCQCANVSHTAREIDGERSETIVKSGKSVPASNEGKARPQAAADAPLERVAVSSRYWPMVPSTSCPSACHSVHDLATGPQTQYGAVDGTLYVLWENVRFFDPFTYGATCVEVQELR